MAPDVLVASCLCSPCSVSSLTDSCPSSSRMWKGCSEQFVKCPSGSLFSREVSLWGKRLPKRLSGKEVQQSRRSKLVVSTSATDPKPPIFVLKKPLRNPPNSDGGIVSKNPAPQFEDRGDVPLHVNEDHKSGYVALIGKPNVGKSTLLNQIIGQKLSIVTNKPQTTRHRILGICSAPEYQMVLYDTPGLMHKTTRRLDQMMMQNVRSARINADCVLMIVDACQKPEKMDDFLEEGIEKINEKRPTLLVLNKIDLIKPGEIAKKKEWYETYGGVDMVLPVSAKLGLRVDDVKKWAVGQLPSGPAYYPKDIVSEHTERFFVSEIVREKIFIQYREEIPYVSQVNVLNYTERKEPSKDFIEAEIVVERLSQMSILIGKDGGALKLLATASRLDIEDFIGKQVYLELKVKVRENWREDENLLDYYGYGGKIRS